MSKPVFLGKTISQWQTTAVRKTPWLVLTLFVCCHVGKINAQPDDAVVESEPLIEADSSSDATSQPTSDALDNELRLAIEEIEIQGGPFDLSLMEPLQGLADLLTEQGDYSEALQLYGRLLHISRINEGLYNENQFAIVDKVINGNLALQDWQALNDSKEYYYFIAQRVHAGDEARLLESLNQHIDWKLTYFGLDTNRDKSKHLLELKELTDQAVELTDELNKDDKLALARSYYRRAMVHYYFVVAIDRSQETGHELGRLQSGTTAALLNPNYVPSNLETNPQMRREFSKGETFLDDIRALFSKPEEKQQLAMATVYLGDWYLLRDRRGPALSTYKKAFELFKQAGLEAEEINKLFEKPVAIPVAAPTFSTEELRQSNINAADAKPSGDIADKDIQPSSPAADRPVHLDNYYAWSDTLPSVHFPFASEIDPAIVNEENFIDIKFTVAVVGKELATLDPHGGGLQRFREGRGNARDVEVVDADTSKQKTRWEGLDDIDLLMFRPRLVSGEAEETQVTMRYIFAPDQ